MDAYLVPSGDEDGCARQLRDDDSPKGVFGRVLDPRRRNGRVEALVNAGGFPEPLERWVERMIQELHEVNARQLEELRLSGNSAQPCDQQVDPGGSDPQQLKHTRDATACRSVAPPLPAESTAGGQQTAQAAGKQAASAARGLAVSPGDSEEERLVVMALAATSAAAGDTPAPQPTTAPPITGEWPWEVPGRLDAMGRLVVTPAIARLNRLNYRFKLISVKWGMKVVRKPPDTWDTYFCTAEASINATGETICVQEVVGSSEAEVVNDAARRLLEAHDGELAQMAAATYIGPSYYTEATAATYSKAVTSAEELAEPAESTPEHNGLCSKSELYAMTTRLCQARMHTRQGERLVSYSAVEEFGPPHERRFMYNASLPFCEGRPFLVGATARRVISAERSAAERTVVFINRCVEYLSGSHSFSFTQLRELLDNLRQMRLT